MFLDVLRRSCRNPAKRHADSGVVNRGGKAVGPGEGFDGSSAFPSFPFLCRPHPLQFVLENDAGFSSAQSLVNMLIECIHCGRVSFHRSNSNPFWSRRTRTTRTKNQMQIQRASPRMPPNRRAARVVSDFFAPLWTPTLFPPL